MLQLCSHNTKNCYMMTIQMYDVYGLASYCKDNCFNVFLSRQRRYCLELKKKTLKTIGIYIYIYICVCVCVFVHICVCIYIYIYVCVCVCVCVCV